MNYTVHHDTIIKRAKFRLLEGYTERHHIIPKCMGGTNDPDNLVDLTAREHYVIHQLLVKMYPENEKLVQAAHMMTMNLHGKRSKNRKYSWLRKKHANTMSISMMGNTNSKGKKKPSRSKEHVENHRRTMIGKKKPTRTKVHCENLSNSLTGIKKGPMSDEHKQKIRDANRGRVFTEEHKQKLRDAKAKI